MSDDIPHNIPKELEEFRAAIDALDIELIDVLARRFAVVRNVGHMKVEKDMAVVQSARADLVRQRAVEMAKQKGVPAGFVDKLYEMMIDEAHIIEHAIADAHKKGEAS